MIDRAKPAYEKELDKWVGKLDLIEKNGADDDIKHVAGATSFSLIYLGETMSKINELPTREDFDLFSKTVVKAVNGNGNGKKEKKTFKFGPLTMTGFDVRDIGRLLALAAIIYTVLALTGVIPTAFMKRMEDRPLVAEQPEKPR